MPLKWDPAEYIYKHHSEIPHKHLGLKPGPHNSFYFILSHIVLHCFKKFVLTYQYDIFSREEVL